MRCVRIAAISRCFAPLRGRHRAAGSLSRGPSPRIGCGAGGAALETPLTPLEFMRRTRRLYADREAVVDGDRRMTYAEFFARCDRWSAALQKLGVGFGDRVAYIAPNTASHLESFYAVPQIGAVLVPINYRLIADDFSYILNHSGARIVCVHSDYLDQVESIRD